MKFNFSLTFLLYALFANFHCSESHLSNDQFIEISQEYVKKWTKVISDNSVLRLLPASSAKKAGSNEVTPIHADTEFTKLPMLNDTAYYKLMYCFRENVENTGKYGDMDLIISTAADCLIRSAGKSLHIMTLEGVLGYYFPESHFSKYRVKAEMGLEDRDTISVTYKELSDSNDVIITFVNNLENSDTEKYDLTGKVVYSRGKVNGLLTSKTKTKTNLHSATLRVNCRMDYDEETANTNTSSNEEKTEEVETHEVQITVPAESKSKLIIAPKSKIQTMKVSQPIMLSGFVGVVTKDKDITEKWLLPVSEFSKYFPEHFRPAQNDRVQIVVTDYQTASSFYFYRSIQ